ncbi:L-glutamate gamma-semialdehyde dehydrogenase [soil metagenome]
MTAGSRFRVTYATMSADNEALHAGFDAGMAEARTELGADHTFTIDGAARTGGGWFEERSPIDRDVLVGRYAQATAGDVGDAVAAADRFAPRWAAVPWQERVALLDAAADLISERRNRLAALMGIEVGKNRLEALGDVEESADLIRYYCRQMEEHDGYTVPMNRLFPDEATVDVMRPYGVWVVISPFNFPMALAAGPVGAALVAGNTVVLKPSNQGALLGLELARVLADAGIPAGAFHIVTGSGPEAGAALVTHPGVDGITFTGSSEVGMGIQRTFATRFPKPAICEMGGKNPVVVSRNADLDAAAEGVMRSAFGFGGQKCSAASRAYVERPVIDDFLTRLIERTERIAIGDPLDPGTYLGPVIDRGAVTRYREAVAEAGAVGEIHTGGVVLTEGDLGRGNFVAPTVVSADPSSWLWRRELFIPFVAVAPVDSVDEGLDRANDTEYGLTAGFFSEDPAEVDRFLDRIESGVVYVNRRIGATTGAWPAVQPFGGWKASGTGGKAGGGPYYLAQYLREQSRTVVGG